MNGGTSRSGAAFSRRSRKPTWSMSRPPVVSGHDRASGPENARTESGTVRGRPFPRFPGLSPSAFGRGRSSSRRNTGSPGLPSRPSAPLPYGPSAPGRPCTRPRSTAATPAGGARQSAFARIAGCVFGSPWVHPGTCETAVLRRVHVIRVLRLRKEHRQVARRDLARERKRRTVVVPPPRRKQDAHSRRRPRPPPSPTRDFVPS